MIGKGSLGSVTDEAAVEMTVVTSEGIDSTRVTVLMIETEATIATTGTTTATTATVTATTGISRLTEVGITAGIGVMTGNVAKRTQL